MIYELSQNIAIEKFDKCYSVQSKHENIELDNSTISSFYRKFSRNDFKITLFDLNRDGKNDIIALSKAPRYCGSGGCVLLIYISNKNHTYSISKTTITNAPIFLYKKRSHGANDLVVKIGGGGVRSRLNLVKFNGVKYDYNPTIVKYKIEYKNIKCALFN